MSEITRKYSEYLEKSQTVILLAKNTHKNFKINSDKTTSG